MPRQRPLDNNPVRCIHATDPEHRPHCGLTAVLTRGSVALCHDCDTRRSTLGKGEPARPLPPQPDLDLLAWITHADQHLHQAQHDLNTAVTRARTAGHTWTTIGAALNTTRQAAQQRFRPRKTRPG